MKRIRRRNRSKPVHSLRPRLVVHRSLNNISAQIIDDIKGTTLASASSQDKDLQKEMSKAGSKVDKSKLVGTALGKKAAKAKIEKVVFDRNGYPYHGRVKALAEAVREEGLDF
jgi:large subunit ribosomal protein L18